MLIVQDDTGLVPGANGYVSNNDFRAYMDARARIYLDDDDKIDASIIAATDYVDQRYAYKGRKQGGREQRMQWPRIGCVDKDRLAVQGIPQEVKDATCEYTVRAMAGGLNPDPTQDPSGYAVTKSKKAVGPIDVETEFAGAQGARPSLPIYPAADNYLRRSGLTLSGGDVYRG